MKEKKISRFHYTIRFLLHAGISAGVASLAYLVGMTAQRAGLSDSGFGMLYSLIQPVFGPVLRFMRVDVLGLNAGAALSLFMLLYLRATAIVIPAVQHRLQQLQSIERAYGPVNRPIHRKWLLSAVCGLLGATAITQLPPIREDMSIQNFALQLLRVAIFLGFIVGSTGAAVVGWRLRDSWRRRRKLPTRLSQMSGVASSDNVSAEPAYKTAPALLENTVVADPVDEGLYIALAAELVQAAGSTRQLPDYTQIERPLLELQIAASMTHTGQFQHSNLGGLCKQACELLAAGELKKLPDVQTATRLYERPDTNLLIDLAEELRGKVKA